MQSFGELVETLAGSARLRALVGCEDPPGRTTLYDFLVSRERVDDHQASAMTARTALWYKMGPARKGSA